MFNFPFRQTFYFTLKCNIAVQNIVKKAYISTIGKAKNSSFDVMQAHVIMSINRRSETKRQNEKKIKEGLTEG